MSFMRRAVYAVGAVLGLAVFVAIAAAVVSRLDQRCYRIPDDEARSFALRAAAEYVGRHGPRMYSSNIVPSRLVAEVSQRSDAGGWSQWSYVRVRMSDGPTGSELMSVVIFSNCSIQWISPARPVSAADQ